jgi:hypothetical protein
MPQTQLAARCRPTLAFLTFVMLLVGCGSPVVVPPATTSSNPKPLPDDAQLMATLDEVIDFTGQRVLNTRDHAAWQVVHGILAYGRDLQIEHEGQVQPCVDYLMKGGALRGFSFAPGEKGLDSVIDSGSKIGQGHDDQWLGYMTQAGMKWDDPMVWAGQTYTWGDLVEEAKWDIRQGAEASWSIMAFSTYLPHGATWTASDGTEWNVEKVIEMESKQDINASACGGTHRLQGMTIALNKHLASGGQLTGGWKLAHDKIRDCIETAREFQNPDGSFSTNYFIRPASTNDIALRINTTGHTFEFLAMAMSDEELKEPWMVRAAVHLCELFDHTREMAVECGALFHAAHGLRVYRDRRFGDPKTRASSGPGATTPADAGQADPAPRLSKKNGDAPPPPAGDDPPAP